LLCSLLAAEKLKTLKLLLLIQLLLLLWKSRLLLLQTLLLLLLLIQLPLLLLLLKLLTNRFATKKKIPGHAGIFFCLIFFRFCRLRL
jgi:hypothetical protein